MRLPGSLPHCLLFSQTAPGFLHPMPGVKAFCLQLWSFSFGRFITLMIEEGMLYYFVGCLHGHNVSVKLVAQVVVIVANYFVSKLIVFRRKR